MNYEYTDTFGGEANYCWIERGTVETDDLYRGLRLARKELGLTGVKGDITLKCGDMIAWKPRGLVTILFVSWEF